MRDNDPVTPARRAFLRRTVAAGGAAVLVAGAARAGALSNDDPPGEAPAKDGGYRKTPHVARYYATLRF